MARRAVLRGFLLALALLCVAFCTCDASLARAHAGVEAVAATLRRKQQHSVRLVDRTEAQRQGIVYRAFQSLAAISAPRGGIGEWNFFTSLNGLQLQVRDVKVGDLVHVGGGTYEPVLALLPQSTPIEPSDLVKISLEDGEAITMSLSHLVLSDAGQLPAHRLLVGDSLRVYRDGNLSHASVVSLSPAQTESSVRMPITPSCRLDVNGIIVSCASTGTAPPDLIAAVMVPVRVLHAVAPLDWYAAVHDHVIIACSGPWHFAAAVFLAMLCFRFAQVSRFIKFFWYLFHLHTNG